MLILFPISLLSGILTVFSPCVLPILPVVLASGVDGKKTRIKGLIFGIVISFSVASLFLTAIITSLGISADSLRTIVSFLLFLIGLSIIFPVWDRLQPLLEELFHKQPKSNNDGFSGGFLTGIGLGIVWTPCVGPLVATISTLAALNELSFASFALVLTYAIGIAIPLWFIAIKGSEFTSRLTTFKKNPTKIRQVFGIILVLTALLIYSGYERKVQAWFLDNLPENWTQIAVNLENRFNVQDKVMDSKQRSSKSKGKSTAGQFSADRYYTVDKDDIKQGCLGGKDCIPSIDNPKFETALQASTWLKDTDVILGLNQNGEQKAYPKKIMNWHEIVNDTVGGDDIVITFCPLCGTGVSFKRKNAVEFGVSGKLYESNLIMYDRTNEENWWLQASGEAIAGPAAKRGEVLDWVATTTTTWAKWKEKYPNTKVLSRDTGFLRDYNIKPYNDYEKSERLLFDVENDSDIFDRKAVVFGIEVGGVSKAYLKDDLQKVIEVNGEIEDVVGKSVVVISRTPIDEYVFINKTTGDEIIPLQGFWFSWYTLHTDTKVFKR